MVHLQARPAKPERRAGCVSKLRDWCACRVQAFVSRFGGSAPSPEAHDRPANRPVQTITADQNYTTLKPLRGPDFCLPGLAGAIRARLMPPEGTAQPDGSHVPGRRGRQSSQPLDPGNSGARANDGQLSTLLWRYPVPYNTQTYAWLALLLPKTPLNTVYRAPQANDTDVPRTKTKVGPPPTRNRRGQGASNPTMRNAKANL